MSECRKFEIDLSACIDGELTPARRAEVETHVAGCAVCRQRVEEMRALADGLAGLPKLQPSPRFLADVRRKLRPASRTWWQILFEPWWLKLPVEALVVVAIAGAALLLSRPPSKPARSQITQAAKREASADYFDRPTGRAAPLPTAAPPTAAPARPILTAPEESAAKADDSNFEYKKQLLVGGMLVPTNTVLVTSADANAVRAQVMQLAKAYGGHLLPASSLSRDEAQGQSPPTASSRVLRKDRAVGEQRFWVEVPVSKVAQFQGALASANELGKPAAAAKPVSGEEDSRRAGAKEKARSDGDKLGTESEMALAEAVAEPMTTLEIIVVPPAN